MGRHRDGFDNLPLANPHATPKHITADYYYRIPVDRSTRVTPFMHWARSPLGYIEWLKHQEPQTVFDSSELKTPGDWIRAGEIVFDAPIFYDAVVKPAHIKDPSGMRARAYLLGKTGHYPISSM